MKLENNSLWIKEARLGFPALMTPKSSVPGADPKYNCTFIMNPAAPEFKEAMEMIGVMAAEKWGENAAAVMNMVAQDKRLRCYGSGNEKISGKTSKVYDGFQDMVFIGAANADKPKLYGTDAQELPPTANGNQMFTGGNYVSGIISFWLQDNQFGRGVRANLEGVQYIREGEHFGADSVDTAGVFQAVAGAPAATGGMPAVVAPAVAPAVAPVAPTVPNMADPAAFL